MVICTYCGEPACSLDHVVPYLFAGKRGTRRGRAGQAPGYRVPSCKECNSWLGTKMLLSVDERRRYIAEKLRRKARAPRPDWSEDELDELGPSLRAAVQMGVKASQRLQERLSYAERGRA